MLYLINNILDGKSAVPFDFLSKDAVVVGRGRINRDRYIFNLEKVNLFFLHHTPSVWAMNYYRNKFPETWKKSIFVFIHKGHLDDLLAVYKNLKGFNVLSWEGKPDKIKVNNVSTAALSFLDAILVRKNIFLSAFDYTNEEQWVFKNNRDGIREWRKAKRNWKLEASHLNKIIAETKNNNLFVKITGNCFLNCELSSPDNIILGQLSDNQIETAYILSGSKLESEPGELIKERFPGEEK